MWHVSGSYYEACNCQVVCPCRREGDRPGGRSTYGECDFVLSWWITEGDIDGRSLAGRKAVLVGHYSDDEPGSPWSVSLVVDSEATKAQVADVAGIFLGRLGGDTSRQYADSIAEVLGTHQADIDLVHERGRWRIGVDKRIEVRSVTPADSDGPVSCGIPGHQQPGTEMVSDVITVELDAFHWDLSSRCSYESRFDYSG
jgi:hypothetical protein